MLLRDALNVLKTFQPNTLGQSLIIQGMILNHSLDESLTHVQKAIAALGANTATERHTIERSYDCKYSILYELPAFDVVQFHVVDPMHNLFLGIAKHTTKQWEDIGALSSQDYVIIQSRVDSMVVPAKIREKLPQTL